MLFTFSSNNRPHLHKVKWSSLFLFLLDIRHQTLWLGMKGLSDVASDSSSTVIHSEVVELIIQNIFNLAIEVSAYIDAGHLDINYETISATHKSLSM